MIRPLSNRVVVQRLESSSDRTSGGLYIPEVAKEKPTQGIVVAVGEGRYGNSGLLIPVDVSTGDRIIFGKYSGSDVQFEGKELLIVREDEILGVIEND